MKARDFRGDFVSRRFIIRMLVAIVVVSLGVLGYVVLVKYSAVASERGTRDVLARVRVADGLSEDELFVDQTMLEKQVVQSGLFSNNTVFRVAALETGGGSTLAFSDCTVPAIYEPVQCVADDGKTYWVTLTEETDAKP